MAEGERQSNQVEMAMKLLSTSDCTQVRFQYESSKTYEIASQQGNNQQNMITGELKSQVDRIWNAFWTGGIE